MKTSTARPALSRYILCFAVLVIAQMNNSSIAMSDDATKNRVILRLIPFKEIPKNLSSFIGVRVITTKPEFESVVGERRATEVGMDFSKEKVVLVRWSTCNVDKLEPRFVTTRQRIDGRDEYTITFLNDRFDVPGRTQKPSVDRINGYIVTEYTNVSSSGFPKAKE